MTPELSAEFQRRNLDFLLRKLRRGDAHREVSERFRSATDVEMSRLLRHHREASVNDPEEIAFRHLMDEWLAEVGILYVAYLCGYITDPTHGTSDGRIQEVRVILAKPELRAYYETHYPIALPWLLRLHLEASVQLKAAESPPAAAVFERFSVLYERFRIDKDLLQFLDFLDAFWYRAEGGANIKTVVNAFADPNRVAAAFQRPVDQLTRVDRGIVGLVRLLICSRDLDALLQVCGQLAALQSALWFFYAYWYREFQNDVNTEATQAIDKALAAIKNTPAAAKDVEKISELGLERERLSQMMERLTNGTYAAGLIGAVRATGQPDAQPWLLQFDRYLTPRSAAGADSNQVNPDSTTTK